MNSMGTDARTLVRSLERLTRLARQAGLQEVLEAHARPLLTPASPRSREQGWDGGRMDSAKDGPRVGWWVLAQGGALDPDDFAARETVREELLDAVRASGVFAGENVWVWDETGRAQLVLATLPTRERAQRVAERLREKGLRVIVRREMP